MLTADPVSTKSSPLAAGAGRLLASSRKLVALRLGAAWREYVGLLAADLQQRGDAADERELRQFFGGLREKLLASAEELERLLQLNWQLEFDAALSERPAAGPSLTSELRLVDLADFDEDLALKALARGIEESNAEAVYAVGRRIAVLVGLRRADDTAAAAAPDIFAAAVRRSLIASGFGLAERLELLRCLTGHSSSGVAAVYREWNEHLKRLKVLPELKHAYGRAAPVVGAEGSAPATRRVAGEELFGLLQGLVRPGDSAASQGSDRTVATEEALAVLDGLQRTVPDLAKDMVAQTDSLRQFRASDIGQTLGRLDAITVDIVAMLFDMIFQDDTIADSIKVLIGRLQIPVLKVALADRHFFSSRAHPARRLLEAISNAAVQLGRGAGREDALYGKLVGIVERLRREFSRDPALLDELRLELEAFLAERNRAADLQAVAGEALASAQELRLTAQAEAERALAPHVALAPQAIRELLCSEWRDLLALAHAGGDRAAWDSALATAGDLVASTKIEPGGRGRKELVERLPGLVRRIQEGFDRLGVDPERRLQLVDSLFALHAALLSGEATSGDLGSGAAPAAVATPGAEALAQVARLARGNWIELAQANRVAQRYRVSWIGPARGVLLLTNPSAPRGIALSAQVLAFKLERGHARIVPSEPIFERAVVRALRSLSDEEAAGISLDFT